MAEENTTSEENSVTVAPEVVDRARRMGWTSKEEFKGDPNKFIEADKFVAILLQNRAGEGFSAHHEHGFAVFF